LATPPSQLERSSVASMGESAGSGCVMTINERSVAKNVDFIYVSPSSLI
jgi:hypothetical protein